jgi:hypothetical protein
MEKPYSRLTEREIKALKLLKINYWDVIKSNSGGHKCITNIDLKYFGKETKELLIKFKNSFVEKLKQKIDGDSISENIFTKKTLLKEVKTIPRHLL